MKSRHFWFDFLLSTAAVAGLIVGTAALAAECWFAWQIAAAVVRALGRW